MAPLDACGARQPARTEDVVAWHCQLGPGHDGRHLALFYWLWDPPGGRWVETHVWADDGSGYVMGRPLGDAWNTRLLPVAVGPLGGT